MPIYVYTREPLPKRTPPPQRAKVLAFIKAQEVFPSLAQIARHMGYRSQTANDALNGLVYDGQLRRLRERGNRHVQWELLS